LVILCGGVDLTTVRYGHNALHPEAELLHNACAKLMYKYKPDGVPGSWCL
jgi:hypothetical protein